MIVISFDSTNYAMLADKCFSEEQFEKMVVPTPRAISNSCGISIQINQDDIDEAIKLIENKDLKIKGIFKVEKNLSEKIY